MKCNKWINRLIIGSLLLVLVSSAGAQAAAPAFPLATDGISTPGTSSISNSNAPDPKQAIDDFIADADQPIGADEIVSFLTDGVTSAMQAYPLGPAAVFNPATTWDSAAAKLTDSKFVVAYADGGNSQHGTAIVGQAFGTAINWGDEYVFNSASTAYPSVATLSDSKFVVAYWDGGNSEYGTAIVGQVSGTTITWGNEYVFNAAVTRNESVTALSDSKFVVAYIDHNGYGTAIVGQAFGTTISYGFAYVFNSAITTYPSVAALSDGKFVVAYTDVSYAGYGTAIVGEVSSYTINFGSEYVFNSAITGGAVAALTDSTFVVAYWDEGNSDYGTAIVGQVSGTSVSYGSETVFNPAGTFLFPPGGVTRLSDTSFVVGFENRSDNDGRVMVGTVSGNTIFFGHQVSFNAGSDSAYITVAGLSPTKYVVAWSDESNGRYGTARVGTLPSVGSAAVFNPAATFQHIAAAKLTDSKFVLAYEDAGNSGYGTAIVGTVSGTTITWGNEYVFNPGFSMFESVAALSPTKFVVAYMDVGNIGRGTAIVGTVSGTTIIWGSEYVFNTALTSRESVAALTDSKFVVAYRDEGNGNYGTAIVGTVSSGTNISYGAEYVFNTADTAFESVAALSDSKFVVAYTDLGNSYYGTAIVGTVSSTSISYGSEYVFNTATTYDGDIAALSGSTFVVAYQNGGNAGYGTAIVGTVSGTVIGYGPEAVFNPAVTKLFHSGGVARLSPTAFVVGYENDSNDDGRVIVGTLSGNAITFGHQVSYNVGSDSSDVTVVGLSPKFVVAWDDEHNSDYGTAKVGLANIGHAVYLPLVLNNH